MPTEASQKYAAQKLDFLKQSVRVTENLISEVADEKKILLYLSQREELFRLIQSLDYNTPEAIKASCTKGETQKIDQQVDLLMKLNNQAEKSIKKEQSQLLSAMKVNVKEHKFVGYLANPQSPRGHLLDKKR